MRLVELAPPATLTEVARWTIRSVDDLSSVRSYLLTALRDATGEDDGPELERIVLVASELATNALRHGSPPFAVRLLCDEGTATVDVVDHRPDVPPVIATHREPGAGGFGLKLARRAASELGWFRDGNDEKHVWARFATA
ncbi:ATP-binding protein [Puerhibacterium puerhi]|uniref:ATP-binding protein n=1 Tax=Puerhibacterium puerhi TaxID=2692623 RepID=UPI0013573578|nr:ATP-binding protein [Puerhibacterium puerhi]